MEGTSTQQMLLRFIKMLLQFIKSISFVLNFVATMQMLATMDKFVLLSILNLYSRFVFDNGTRHVHLFTLLLVCPVVCMQTFWMGNQTFILKFVNILDTKQGYCENILGVKKYFCS